MIDHQCVFVMPQGIPKRAVCTKQTTAREHAMSEAGLSKARLSRMHDMLRLRW
jgi:hypothetical protein